MREGIHPEYNNIKVTCVCGESFETGSVKKELRVEICYKCHPFYTGSQRTIEIGGRADKFRKKYGIN
ncbi:MAG: 50S ribosomal protein L31 [Peptococcaceae bacterium]|nr:50S ribosomal protein L31 [Peptococcaceae bacterium]